MTYHEMNVLMAARQDILCHHGIKGQRWGVENGPPYPLSDAEHKAVVRSSRKYQNLDGSLNEKGIDHKIKYLNKQINKNNKYYDKQISKYTKKYEKEKDDNEKSRLKWRLDNAKKTKDEVNKYISEMTIKEILDNEKEDKERAVKIAKRVAGTVALASGVVFAPAAISYMAGKGSSWFNNADPNSAVNKAYDWIFNSTVGQKASEFVDTAVRTYSDARAYVVGTMVDQTVSRLKETGTLDMISSELGKASGSAISSMASTSGVAANEIAKSVTPSLMYLAESVKKA